jgi:hypothetical protein
MPDTQRRDGQPKPSSERVRFPVPERTDPMTPAADEAYRPVGADALAAPTRSATGAALARAPLPGTRPLDVLRLQRLCGNQAVQRRFTAQTSPDEHADLGSASVQRRREPGPVVSRAAPVGAPVVGPTTATGGSVSVHWLADRKTRETYVITRSSTTLAALGLYLYGDAAASVDLAALNGRDPTAAFGPGARLKVAPLAGRKPTPEAARDFNASPWWPIDERDPSALLARMGVSSPADFQARKRQLDAQLDQDFQIIVAKLNEARYDDADEGQVLDILRRWGEEKLTIRPERYPNGGDYLDQLFGRLRRKTKDVGIVTDQLSDYYSLMFNHFDRVGELENIRDTYSRGYRRDSGYQESSLGSFFWDEVKSGAIRDQIFAYCKGVGKGAWSGLKGSLNFAKTLVTDPGKAWDQIKSMPSAMKKLWKNRQALWNQFVSASPEEQAEIIGKLVGEVEFALASSAAGGAAASGVSSLAKAPGWLGRTARLVGVVTSMPAKIAGRLRNVAAGAVKVALGELRAASQSLMGSLRGLGGRVGKAARGGNRGGRAEPLRLYHGTEGSQFGGLGALGEGRINVARGAGVGDDLSRGFYLTDDQLQAVNYALERAKQQGGQGQHVLKFEISTDTLGAIVDVRPGGNFAKQWEVFLDAPPPGLPIEVVKREGFRTTREFLTSFGVEQRGRVFERFLESIGMTGADTIFAPLGQGVFTGISVPSRASYQVCIRSQRIADHLNAIIRGVTKR